MSLDVVITSALLYYNFGLPFLVTFGATYVGYAAVTISYAKVILNFISRVERKGSVKLNNKKNVPTSR